MKTLFCNWTCKIWRKKNILLETSIIYGSRFFKTLKIFTSISQIKTKKKKNERISTTIIIGKLLTTTTVVDKYCTIKICVIGYHNMKILTI